MRAFNEQLALPISNDFQFTGKIGKSSRPVSVWSNDNPLTLSVLTGLRFDGRELGKTEMSLLGAHYNKKGLERN